MTIQEERMIEVALREAVELYPNLNLLVMQPDDGESNYADLALQKARSKNDAANAIDILKMISKGADDNFAFTITTKKLYLNPQMDLGIKLPKDIDIDITDISSENAVLYSIWQTRNLDLLDRMHLMQHYVCSYIGRMAYGLEQTCDNSECMMQEFNPKSSNLIQIATMERHAEERICEKCRKKLFEKMTIDERITPSYIDII